MVVITMDLNNINLDDDHFDEDDPETCGGASSGSK